MDQTARTDRSPLAAGFAAALRHRRLALVLWLSLVATSALALPQLGVLAAFFDDSPFHETLTKGWDSWGIVSWLAYKGREIQLFLPLIGFLVLVSLVLQIFLTGGVLRVLIKDVNRPVLRHLISEAASTFRANLWSFARFAVTLGFWQLVVVGSVAVVLKKIAGDDAPPNNGYAIAAEYWTLGAGALVFLLVGLRWDLARIAIARDDAPTARGAYRVSALRLEGGRLPGVLLSGFWLLAGLVVQSFFTNAGIRLNPQTDGAVRGLVIFRQLGFILLAMVRVGYWGTLLQWEAGRRPVARAPLPRHAGFPMQPLYTPPQAPLAPVPEPAAETPPAPEPGLAEAVLAEAVLAPPMPDGEPAA